MRRDDDQLPASYFAVPLANLEVETVLSFDLYIKHYGVDPLLYRAKNMAFTPAVKDRLIAHGVRELHVPVAQAEEYRRYREEHAGSGVVSDAPAPAVSDEEAELPRILRDRVIEVEKRSRILVGVSRDVVRAALADLNVPGLGARITRVSEEAARFLLSDIEAFPSLVALLGVDSQTYSHMSNTALYATELARASGFGDLAELTRIGRAALLHDVGKALIPHALLDRGDDLTDLEYAEFMEHTRLGVRCLIEAGFTDEMTLDVAANHHERIDGSGFPRGMRGDEISPASRIVGIVDVFDRLTTRRRGGVEMTGYQALWSMKRDHAGSFDERLLEAFIQVMVEPSKVG